MKAFFFLLIIAFQVSIALSQKQLLPYLANDRYGVADESGKIIITPKYEAVVILDSIPLILVRQNGLWGLLNILDQLVLPIEMQESNSTRSRVTGSKGPSIERSILRKPFPEEIPAPVVVSHLCRIHDQVKDGYYFINPYVTLQSYTLWKKVPHDMFSRYTGIIEVVAQDDKVNFVDTTGREILTEHVAGGHVLSPHVLAITETSKKTALYNVQGEAMTTFKYKQASQTDYLAFIIAERVDSAQNNKSFYSLFDTHGKLLIEDFPNKIRVIGDRAILEVDGNSKLLDPIGNVVYETKASCLYEAFPRKDILLFEKQQRYGIISSEGKTLVSPEMIFLEHSMDSNWLFKSDDAIGVMDKYFHIKWSIPDTSFSPKWNYNASFVFIRKTLDDGSARIGLIDSSGQILFEPHYSSISDPAVAEWVLVLKDSLHALFDLSGNTVIPFSDSVIHIVTSEIPKLYERKKEIYFSIKQKKRIQIGVSPQVKIMQKNGKFRLTDLGGNQINQNEYDMLREFKDLDISRALFMARQGDSHFADILNESGNSILPPGFGGEIFMDKYTHGGLVYVIRSDVEDPENYLYRQDSILSGVIDIDGNWVIPPDYRIKRFPDHKFVVVYDSVNLEMIVYNRYGALAEGNPYSTVSGFYVGGITNDRLVVGRPLNWDAYRQSRAIQENGRLPEPTKDADVIYGCLDRTGKIVLPFQYASIDEFDYTITTVSGKKKNGKTFSAVIDLAGNIIMKTPHELLYLMREDSSLAVFRKKEKLGVMDFMGNVVVQPKYDMIEKCLPLDMYILTSGDSVFAAPSTNPEKMIWIGFSGNFKYHHGGVIGFTVIESDRSHKEQYCHTFDKQGQPYQYFEGYGFSKRFQGRFLPHGYLTVQDSQRGLPYVINGWTGMKYKAE